MVWLRLSKESPRVVRFLASLRSLMLARLTLPAQAAAVLVFAAIVGYGCSMELQIAHHNANPDLTQEPWYSDIEAAEWIQSHEPGDRVVMARKQDLVFHYTQHRVIWFPPISDSKTLMDGIRAHHVSLIVVVARKNLLWLPPEDLCFKALLDAYPSSFQILHAGSNWWIYRLAANGSLIASR